MKVQFFATCNRHLTRRCQFRPIFFTLFIHDVEESNIRLPTRQVQRPLTDGHASGTFAFSLLSSYANDVGQNIGTKPSSHANRMNVHSLACDSSRPFAPQKKQIFSRPPSPSFAYHVRRSCTCHSACSNLFQFVPIFRSSGRIFPGW